MAKESSGRPREISDGMLRQRRNLMSISILMPLFMVSGASVEKLNLLGTIIDISKPEIINYSIFILYSYFLIRYRQYYKEETHVSEMRRVLKSSLYHWESFYLKKLVLMEFPISQGKNLQLSFSDCTHSPGWGVNTDLPEISDKFLFPFYKKGVVFARRLIPSQEFSELECNATNEAIEKDERFEKIVVNGEYDEKEKVYYKYLYKYNFLLILYKRMLGYVRFVFDTSYFTDYQLPFVIAVTGGGMSLWALLAR